MRVFFATALFCGLVLEFLNASSVHGLDDDKSVTKRLRQSSTARRGLNLPEWFCSFFDGAAPDSDCESNATSAENVTCPRVEPLSNGTGIFDLDQFTAHSWFVQKQQINGFQPKPEDLYCLVHTWVVSGCSPALRKVEVDLIPFDLTFLCFVCCRHFHSL